MVNVCPLTAEIGWRVWGTPANFNEVRVLASLLRRRQPNFSLCLAVCWAGILYTVSQKVPPLACYNFDTREWILIFFGRNVTDKVGNQKRLYYATLK